MLADGVGIFELQPRSVAVLSHGCFESNTAARIDRVTGAAEERLREAAVRSESCRLRAPICDRLPCIAPHEKPLAGLPLELKDILEIVVHPVVIEVELSHFTFRGDPWRWDRKVATDHQQLWVKTPDTQIPQKFERGQMIEAFVNGCRILHVSYMIPPHTHLRPAREIRRGLADHKSRRELGKNCPSLIEQWEPARRKPR